MTARIITREEWGARYRGGWSLRPLPATEAWLHYPGAKAPPGPDATLAQDIAYIRYLEDIGYQRFGPHTGTGWGTDSGGEYGAGISYSLLFAKSGRVFRGHDPRRQSSHTAGHNGPGMGYCVLLSNGEQANSAQIQAIGWALNEQVRIGELVTPQINGGHRDVYATICPTDKVQAQIPTINTVARGNTDPKPTPLLAYPARAAIGTAQFWRDIEAVIRSEGFDIYCGRSHYDKGWCAPGKHGHGKTSLHFEGLALDFGRDGSGAAVSVREKIYNSAKIKMLRAYYGSQMGWVHDRGPNDHEDHGHVQARPNKVNGKLWDNTLAGVTMFGDRGQAVTDWQDSLKKAGATLTVDGSYGLETFWATRRWQSSRGLAVDSIIGAGSRTEMTRHLTQIEAEKLTDGVIDLTQYAAALAALGYPATEAGVRAFQSERTGAPHHLDPDGKFGPLTKAALEADMATLDSIAAKIDSIPADVWGRMMNRAGEEDPTVRADTLLRYTATGAQVAELNAKVAALSAAVETLASKQGIDPGAVTAAIREAVEKSTADMRIVLTTSQEG